MESGGADAAPTIVEAHSTIGTQIRLSRATTTPTLSIGNVHVGTTTYTYNLRGDLASITTKGRPFT